MSKRPSLAGLARPKPVAGVAGGNDTTGSGAGPASPGGRSARRAPAPVSGPATDADMHAMTLRIPKATSKALKMRAIDEERPVTDLVRDAIDDYLSRRRG